MKAIVINQPGGVEQLKLQEVKEPVPQEGEVKIKVKAFGLNRVETYFRQGNYGAITEPRTPGIEAVGEVVKDASGTYLPGQRVITAMGGLGFSKNGSYAEYLVAPHSHVLPVEAELAWEELATLPEAYLTVWGALQKNLELKAGETLLVRGGTSSVGLAAIVYAQFIGAKVVATTRNPDNVARLKEFGAEHVLVDSGEIAQDVRTIMPQGVDKVLEVIGAPTVKDSLKSVRHWGEVCVIGLLGGSPVLDSFGLMSDLPNTVKLSFFSSGLLGSEQLPFADSPINELASQLARGKLPSLLSKTFELDEIQAAHEYMESNRSLGKLVVTV